jgi:hypothetical protein
VILAKRELGTTDTGAVLKGLRRHSLIEVEGDQVRASAILFLA